LSKELAQTVGGKRTAWLIAILAAFAVFATVATQWRGADAIVPSTTITITDGSSAGAGDTWTYTASFVFNGTEAATPAAVFYFPHDSELQFVNATGDIGPIEGDECAYYTSTTVRCIDNDASVDNYVSASLSLNFMVPYEGAYVQPVTFTNGNCYLDDNGAGVAYCTASNLATFGADNAVQADPEYAINAVGVAHTVTFTLPAGMSCGSDDYNNDGDLDGQVDCVESDVNTDAGEILDITVRDADTSDESYVDVTIVDADPETVYIQLYVTSDSENDGGGTTFYSESAQKDYVLAELRHIDDDPDWDGDGSDVDVIADQDVNNNVVGSTHVVCTIVANSDGQGGSEIWTDDADPIYVPFQAGDITFSAGGGYLSTADDEPTVDDLQVFEGNGTSPYEPAGYEGNGGLGEASCFSWISTGAGDQQITVTYEGDDGNTYTVRWDTDGNVASVNSRALIKEWNQLEDSQVTLSGGATGTGSGNSASTPVITKTIQGLFNPSTSRYDFDDVYIDDIMRGSHTTRTGQKLGPLSLHGVNWHIAGFEGCGDINNGYTYAFDYLWDGGLDDSSSDTYLYFYNNDAYYNLYIGQIIAGFNEDGDVEFMQIVGMTDYSYYTEVEVVRNVRSPYEPTQPAPGLLEFEDGDPFAFIQTTWIDSDPEGGYDVTNTPNVVFNSGDWDDEVCGPGSYAEVTIVGGEPGPQGSSDGDIVVQIIRFNFTAAPPPTKAVFLAWAGQRVLLEYDWRLPAGDDPTDDRNEYDPVGECPWGYYRDTPNGSTDVQGGEGFYVSFTRGSGPGNFVPGLYAWAYDNGGWRNGATVWTWSDNDQSGDAPWDPQDACISRVIYESEDEGQVDIEAFTEDWCSNQVFDCDSDNQTKIAFVIYYMKIEKVSTSLVTGNDDGAGLVKKPKHNATGSDFAPGNPWRYDNDLTAAESNVSTDVLVRVKVKGWFLTSNPSGRERDASDPNNVLPQDRWVMPDDWARLIAGGAGIDFRPEYDYMFAPNNTKGITLDIPCGCGAVLVTKVAASSSNSTTSLKVESLANLPIGAQVKVGSLTNSTRTVTARNTDTNVITLDGAVASSTPSAGANVWIVGGVPFEGPFSLIDIQNGADGNGLYGQGYGSAALSEHIEGSVRDTRHGDQVLDWYDAPMPPTPITVDIRKAGFLKQVDKADVYWTGTVDSSTQDYPNPYYITNIPESPYLPAKTATGDFLWDSWGNDGPQGNGMGNYYFWEAVRVGTNISGNAGETLTTAEQTELSQIRTVYGDSSIARRLVVFSDNHGEAMVIANGDFKLTYDECTNNLLGGGKHCDTGDLVGSSDIFATADYPDFRGKHAPVRSNTATIDWTWGGFKTVTIEPGEVEQYVYVVFRALDRDGFCNPPSGAVSLHPVLTSVDAGNTVGAKDPVEAVDFLIDSDEGGIIIQTSAGTSAIDVTREATKEGGLPTYSTTESGRSETATDNTKKFAPLNGATAECQAWVKLSNSLLGITNVLVFAHDDEGLIGFDKIVDFNDTVEYTLNFRWSLITWMGADNIAPAAALGATGGNAGGTDILDEVTAVYGWEASSQSWLAFFPDGVDIPGANDLTGLRTGNAYWIAIKGPSSITWSVVTDVD